MRGWGATIVPEYYVVHCSAEHLFVEAVWFSAGVHSPAAEFVQPAAVIDHLSAGVVLSIVEVHPPFAVFDHLSAGLGPLSVVARWSHAGAVPQI